MFSRVFAALLLAVSILMPSLASADSITWRIRSFHKNVVDVEFYSQNRRHVWPGGGKVYTLRDYESHQARISCIRGEKICFGAWVRGNPRSYWGVGRGGKNGCKGCCYTCGGDTTTPIQNLNVR